MVERTLSMIKPDATRSGKVGAIVSRFERAGLVIVAATMVRLTRERAKEFYAVHKERPFFDELVDCITAGLVMALALEGPGAIARVRILMGATDPQEAAPGTIRADLATSIEANAVHGSDGPETAAQELRFFFPELAARS